MKKALLIFSLGAAIGWSCYQTAQTRSGGPPQPSTGAIGEGTCLACHNNQNNPARQNITMKSSKTAFRGGDTLRLVFRTTGGNGPRYGFQLTARDKRNNSSVGTFISASGQALTNFSGNNYINHNTPSTRDSVVVQWISPTTGTDTAVFYIATYNGNGSGSLNSAINNRAFTVPKLVNPTSARADLAVLKTVSVAPNPATDRIAINLKVAKSEVVIAELVSLEGRVVETLKTTFTPENSNATMYFVNQPAAGVYTLRLHMGDAVKTQRVVLQ